MKDLAYLRLDGSKVCKTVVAAVVMVLKDTAIYQNFRFISVTDCGDDGNCIFTPEELNEMKRFAPHVDVACTIDAAHLMP